MSARRTVTAARRPAPAVVSCAVLAALAGLAGCRGDGRVSLGDPALWTAHPADGVTLKVSGDDGALRLDFTFTGGGYAIARRAVDLDLPADYAFRFRMRGEAPANHLEFKLIDQSGQNVWWHVMRDVEWPSQWRTFTIKKRQLGFAWGPAGGGGIAHVGALEFAVTAGSGGRGTVWIDGLELVPLPVPAGPPPPPRAGASSAEAGHPAALAADGDPGTWWAPGAGDTDPVLELDLGRPREFGGLTLVWAPGRHAADYAWEGSADRKAWDPLQAVAGSDGGTDDLFLPESESRWLRLRLPPAGTVSAPAVAEVTIQPLEWSATREAFFMSLAARARRGLYPRGFLGEPSAWTVVGVDRDTREGLLGADGALEAGPGEFSLEPFLWTDGRLLTWQDVTATQTLADGVLPIPSVTWECGSWRLAATASGTGEPGRSLLLARYVLENRGAQADSATLYLALRPFQVNPPSQFLNIRGGTAHVGGIARDGGLILVDGRPRVRLLRTPDAFGATTFAGGDVVADHLEAGRLPAAQAATDAFGAASAAAAYRLALAPGSSAVVEALVALHDEAPLTAETDGTAALAFAEASWRAALGRVVIHGPPAAHDAIATLQAQLGYILVNRAGERIQPGARAYARSWIRDGALTGEALLRTGHADAVRDFLVWFAPHQYENGKIPCVVDRRGADPVPEHDSTGEFIFLVAQYYRYTGDRALRDRMWPRVAAGVRYLEDLLAERSTAEYQAADKREFYGILPPSISHEGYSAKPMHSYWDDFFALRGLRDAAWLAAGLVGDGADSLVTERDRLQVLRDRFAANLGASVTAAMARHGIDYVPGCADLGDFDATSTTVALDPAAAEGLLPAGALDRTFERYWDFFARRRDGEPWEAFTPYEIRSIGAFVRLGWRERAHDLLTYFLAHRTPPGWRQWPEVVGSDPQKARFIGDMPHTWVGSDYIRACLDMFVYERREESARGPALVLAAGVVPAWLDEGGITVADLPTPFGRLAYRLYSEGADILMEIDAGVTPPAGGLVLAPPVAGARPTINGETAATDQDGRVVVRQVPVRVRWLG